MSAARVVSGWSQAEFAERLRAAGLTNVHQNTVSRIEKGERPLRMAESQTIASLFDLTVDEMLREDFGTFLTWIDVRSGQRKVLDGLIDALVAYVEHQAFTISHRDRLRAIVGDDRLQWVLRFADTRLVDVVDRVIPEIPDRMATKPMSPVTMDVARKLVDEQINQKHGEHREAP